MANDYAVVIEGIDAFRDLEELPKHIQLAAQQAANKTILRARAEASRRARSQVNFPARYLSGSKGRLQIAKMAKGGDLEAILRGKARPTSLATFTSGSPKPSSRGGVSVSVKPGSTTRMPRAFLIKLRSGAASIDTRFNLGLAMRLKPGETVKNKKQMVKVKGNLYLLYGPSVQQVMLNENGEGVFDDIAEPMSDFFEQEFARLMELRNG